MRGLVDALTAFFLAEPSLPQGNGARIGTAGLLPGLEGAAACHHGPSCARHLAGQRHSCLLEGQPPEQRLDPGVCPELALIEERESTCVLGTGGTVMVDARYNLVAELRYSSKSGN